MTTFILQVWDIVFFLVLAALHFLANYEDRRIKDQVAEWNLQMLGTASTGGLVAVSILTSAIMLLLTGNEFTAELLSNLVYGMVLIRRRACMDRCDCLIRFH